jgi:pantothenate kinase type III
VLLAGGAAVKLAPFLDFAFEHADNLVLEGLAWMIESTEVLP